MILNGFLPRTSTFIGIAAPCATSPKRRASGATEICGTTRPSHVERNPRVAAVVGHEHQLFVEVTGRGGVLHPHQQLVGDAARLAAGFGEFDFQVVARTADVGDLPIAAAGVGDADLLLRLACLGRRRRT